MRKRIECKAQSCSRAIVGQRLEVVTSACLRVRFVRKAGEVLCADHAVVGFRHNQGTVRQADGFNEVTRLILDHAPAVDRLPILSKGNERVEKQAKE